MRFACLRWSLIAIFLWGLMACGKGKGPDEPPPEPEEANRVVVTDPATGAGLAPALGPYAVRVSVTSVMPRTGVKVEVKARKDDGSGAPAFFNNSVNSMSAVNNIAITGVPANTVCLVEIKVTSLTKPSNTWNGSYRFSSK